MSDGAVRESVFLDLLVLIKYATIFSVVAKFLMIGSMRNFAILHMVNA